MRSTSNRLTITRITAVHRRQLFFIKSVLRLLSVAADSTVDMSEANAEPLLRAGWARVDDRLSDGYSDGSNGCEVRSP